MNDPHGPAHAGGLSAEAVADYLIAHPDFFQEQRKLLTRLSIPHPAGGAVSLVERQVEILRQENRQFEQRLVDWMEIARDNDSLLARLHALSVALLAVPERPRRIALLAERLRSDFGAAAVILLLPAAAAGEEAAGVRRIDAENPLPEGLEDIVRAGRPVCHALSDERRTRLFGSDSLPASAAFVPLGGATTGGLLVLASADAEHFRPGLDVTYLARLGEIATAALAGSVP